MARSQNGWPANDRSVIGNPRIPGTSIDFPGGIRRGAVTTVLLHVATQLHRRVESGGDGYGCWGYAERPIRGGTQLSNHASGTAIDWIAPRHPLGARGTFSAAQVAEIRRILAEVDHVVRWGGDYTGRADEMHFEINAGAAAVERAAAKLAGKPAPPPPGGGHVAWFPPEVLMANVPVLREGDGYEGGGDRGRLHWYVLSVQQLCNIRALSRQLTVDGLFGPATTAMIRELQQRSGIAVDGVVGPDTWGWLLGNDAPAWA